MNFTQQQLEAMNVVPDGKGGYQVKKNQVQSLEKKPLPSKQVVKESKRGLTKHKSIEDLFDWAHKNNAIYIPGNVPSSKNNHAIWWKNGFNPNSKVKATMNGRPVIPFITQNKLTKQYSIDTEKYWKTFKNTFHSFTKLKQYPFLLHIDMIRSTNNNWDWNNVCQICHDLMQKHEWIENDDWKHLKPVFGNVYIDPKLAGVILRIL